MLLCRVFLLTDEISCEDRKQLEPHLHFIEKYAVDYPGQVEVRFLRCGTDEGLAGAIEHLGHFACIRRRKGPGTALPAQEPDLGCLVVEPLYCAPGKIRELRLLFSQGPGHGDPSIQAYLDRFFPAARKSQPLRELFFTNPKHT